ncbi:MAG: hypothetical protein RSD40_06965 [Bacilli bacterium]
MIDEVPIEYMRSQNTGVKLENENENKIIQPITVNGDNEDLIKTPNMY